MVLTSDRPTHSIHEAPLPNGNTLFWKLNEAGGRTYYSDEIGGGVVVWDTCLVDHSTLLAAITTELGLLTQERHQKEATEHSQQSTRQVGEVPNA